MPRTPNFTPKSTPRGWVVNIPLTMASDGKKGRRYFKTEQEAKRFAGSMRAQYKDGLRGGLIPLALAIQAAEAEEILKPLGVSLVEAAKIVAGKMKESGGSPETFGERYDRAMRDGEMRWRERYLADMKKIPRWVGPKFMKLRVADIDDKTIVEALKKHGASALSTVEARKARVGAILGHKERHRKKSGIRILTWEECSRLLAACPTREDRRVVALLLYAGIRPDPETGEIARLDWADVGPTDIFIRPEVSKTGSDRHIPILPALAAHIAGHPASGPVTPTRWKVKWQAIRKAAEIDGQDVCRHTFASHFLAAYGEDAAKQAMGHTAGSVTLFRHYRRAVKTEDGIAFFGGNLAAGG